MAHSSENLIRTARQQLESRPKGAAEQYSQLARQFQRDAELDSSGLRQCILELLAPPGGLLAGSKPTVRGRFRAFIIRQQARSSWWLLSAVHSPERALQAIYETLRSQDQRQRQLEKVLSELEHRIKELEDQDKLD
jgi:hypothetical protein